MARHRRARLHHAKAGVAVHPGAGGLEARHQVCRVSLLVDRPQAQRAARRRNRRRDAERCAKLLGVARLLQVSDEEVAHTRLALAREEHVRIRHDERRSVGRCRACDRRVGKDQPRQVAGAPCGSPHAGVQRLQHLVPHAVLGIEARGIERSVERAGTVRNIGKAQV